MSILMESFPKEKQGQALGLYGFGVVFAPIIGPILGGWLTDNYSWRWVFYINIPIGLLAQLLIRRNVEDPPWIKSSLATSFDGWDARRFFSIRARKMTGSVRASFAGWFQSLLSALWHSSGAS
jgi:MFS family permease